MGPRPSAAAWSPATTSPPAPGPSSRGDRPSGIPSESPLPRRARSLSRTRRRRAAAERPGNPPNRGERPGDRGAQRPAARVADEHRARARRLLVVADPEAGAVFRLNPATGALATVWSGPPLSQLTGIAVLPDRRLLVTDTDGPSDLGALWSIPPGSSPAPVLAGQGHPLITAGRGDGGSSPGARTEGDDRRHDGSRRPRGRARVPTSSSAWAEATAFRRAAAMTWSAGDGRMCSRARAAGTFSLGQVDATGWSAGKAAGIAVSGAPVGI